MSAWSLRLVIPTALAGLVAMYAVIAHDGAETSYRLWYYVPQRWQQEH